MLQNTAPQMYLFRIAAKSFENVEGWTRIDEPLLQNIQKNFLNTIQKILLKNSLPLPRHRRKNEIIHLLMTSLAMFTLSQYPSYFVRI